MGLRRRAIRTGRALLTAGALVLAGCVATDTEPAAGSSPMPSASPSVATADGAAPPAGELVILDRTGNVIVSAPDGSDARRLTADGEDGVSYTQPTWSPDGDAVAWARDDARNRRSVQIASARGGEPSDTPLDLAPFYLSWDPSGRWIAALGGIGQGGIGLALVATDGSGAAPIAAGQPFYFAWSPDGGRLLTHVAERTLGLLDLDGDDQRLPFEGGGFQAPFWSADGEQVVFVRRDGDAAAVTVAAPDGEDARTLAVADGYVLLVADAAGDRLALQVRRGGQQQDQPALVSAPRGSSIAAEDEPAPIRGEGVVVIDIATGAATAVTDGPTLGFWFSPDGSRLLLLAPTVRDGEPAAEWLVWDGATTTSYGVHVPSPVVLRDYLPFLGQYAQSQTAWSPDGRAFAYAGAVDGEDGVFVQRLDAPRPERVGGGLVVSWSPR